MPDLVFDPIPHTYTLEGVLVPNVTGILEVLGEYAGVPALVLERASAIGTAVHVATELDDKGGLVEESVHPVVRPFLDAWRKFRHDTGYAPDSIEERVFSKRHWYAGTLDRSGPSHDTGKPALIDIKTTANLMPAVGPQLAAYQEAKNYRNATKIVHRYAVQLKKDGNYHVEEYRDPGDLGTFLSCLNIYHWRNKHGK